MRFHRLPELFDMHFRRFYFHVQSLFASSKLIAGIIPCSAFLVQAISWTEPAWRHFFRSAVPVEICSNVVFSQQCSLTLAIVDGIAITKARCRAYGDNSWHCSSACRDWDHRCRVSGVVRHTFAEKACIAAMYSLAAVTVALINVSCDFFRRMRQSYQI